MAYVDNAFSISDEDIMVETSYSVNNKPPIKEIALALALLVFGALGLVVGVLMAVNQVGGDRAHDWDDFDLFQMQCSYLVVELKSIASDPESGIFFALLGLILFLPGFYYTRIAYYAYKGYKGFSFSTIPPV